MERVRNKMLSSKRRRFLNMPQYAKGFNRKMTDDEYKLKDNLRTKKRRQTPKWKAWAKEYNSRIETKIKLKGYHEKWYYSEMGINTRKIYRDNNIEHITNRLANSRAKKRYDLLQNISDSDIPCCKCCGLNSHVDFLEIDHIQGKKVMDSIKELTNIGYSSKLDYYQLIQWITKNIKYIKHLDTDYFQVLCKNCNQAKGMPKNNNTCPHKLMVLQ
jgi:hypothetical protein